MLNTFHRIANHQVLKINVREICHSGWIQNVKGHRLELQRRPQGICLFVNGELTTQVWKVSQVEVPYLEMNNGSIGRRVPNMGITSLARMGNATGIYISWGRKSERELISA
jgi:hypothetical protein